MAADLGTSGGGNYDAGRLLAMQVAPLVGPVIAAHEVPEMMMVDSVAGLGRPELGTLSAGSGADICVTDVSGSPMLASPIPWLG